MLKRKWISSNSLYTSVQKFGVGNSLKEISSAHKDCDYLIKNTTVIL